MPLGKGAVIIHFTVNQTKIHTSGKWKGEEFVFFSTHFFEGGGGVSESPHSTMSPARAASCVIWTYSSQQSPWPSVGADRGLMELNEGRQEAGQCCLVVRVLALQFDFQPFNRLPSCSFYSPEQEGTCWR